MLMELMSWLELVFLVHWVLLLMSFLELACSASKPLLYFDFSGGLLGETFVVKQLLPLLKHVVRSCIDVSSMKKPELVQSWSALALIDCLMTLDGLVAYLPREVVVKELVDVRDFYSHFCSSFVLLEHLRVNNVPLFSLCRIEVAFMLWFLCIRIWNLQCFRCFKFLY